MLAVLPLIMFFIGIAIRVYYCANHSFLSYGHDAFAHVEHIRFIATEGRLPPPGAGWEFYQPPAYYWCCGQWLRFGLSAGLTETMCLEILKWSSCLCSIMVLACVLAIARISFPCEKQLLTRTLFVGMISVIPGMIMLSSQINNDVPAQLVLFAGMVMICRWWEKSSRSTVETGTWLTYSALIALGILTKTNCILLLPVGFLCLAIKRGIPLRKKLGLASITLVVLSLCSGWFVIPRLVAQKSVKQYVIGNYTGIPQSLAVPNDARAMFTFNPLEVLKCPYNDSWSDNNRRQYALEYLFRSTFFGEYNFGAPLLALATVILGSALALVSMGLAQMFMFLAKDFTATLDKGLLQSFIPRSALVPMSALAQPQSSKRKVGPMTLGTDAHNRLRSGAVRAESICYRLLPLWSSAIVFFAALLFNRMIYAYSVCGDFRFISPVVLGFTAMVVMVPNQARLATSIVAAVFMVCCFLFLLKI